MVQLAPFLLFAAFSLSSLVASYGETLDGQIRRNRSLRKRTDRKKLEELIRHKAIEDAKDAAKHTDAQGIVLETERQRRDTALGSTPLCDEVLAEMSLYLVPGNSMEYIDTNVSPDRADLTFCGDKIHLTLNYIVDVGVEFIGIDIACNADQPIVQFLEDDYVVPLGKTPFFVSGVFDSIKTVDTTTVQQILDSPERCYLTVRTEHISEGLLVGRLRRPDE